MPKASSFGVFALSAVLAVALSSAVAADSPAMIPLQGFLTDAKGAPITGSHRLTFTLYDASTNGNALYLDDLLSVDVDDGYFVAYLGNQEKSPLSLSLFRDHPDLWVEVVIDGTEIVQPRTYLASVPHAAMSQYCGDAQTLGGKPATSLVPPGSLMPFAGRNVPDGWLLADGSEVPRAMYPELHAAIGESYGAGDGSTTFNLPDLRSRAAVGAGAGPGLSAREVGTAFGAESHALTPSELPGHTHAGSTAGAGGHSHTTSAEGNHAHSGTTGSGNAMFYRTVANCGGTASAGNHVRGWGGCEYEDRNDSEYALSYHTHNFSTSVAGHHAHTISGVGDHAHGFTTDQGAGLAGAAHPSVPPSLAVSYIIKY